MGIQPEGEDLRKAVKWISEERKYGADQDSKTLIEKACLKFNLSPLDEEHLLRFVREET